MAEPRTVNWTSVLFPAAFFAAISGLLLAFIVLVAPAVAQSRDTQRAAECDEQIKKQKDWDSFAKRRFLEQCLQQGTRPPKGDPAKPESWR